MRAYGIHININILNLFSKKLLLWKEKKKQFMGIRFFHFEYWFFQRKQTLYSLRNSRTNVKAALRKFHIPLFASPPPFLSYPVLRLHPHPHNQLLWIEMDKKGYRIVITTVFRSWKIMRHCDARKKHKTPISVSYDKLYWKKGVYVSRNIPLSML